MHYPPPEPVEAPGTLVLSPLPLPSEQVHRTQRKALPVPIDTLTCMPLNSLGSTPLDPWEIDENNKCYYEESYKDEFFCEEVLKGRGRLFIEDGGGRSKEGITAFLNLPKPPGDPTLKLRVRGRQSDPGSNKALVFMNLKTGRYTTDDRTRES
ncbi:MAG: hypothetical protein LBL71_04685 [Endomicrobium sp.]|jgi:hypothetical protein|nr:hypothetical protein [Endomicrobium sp.]